MLDFQPDGVYPLIKIATPMEIDFFQEHQNIIEKKKYVWFCRFGKNNMKIESLENCEKILLIKDSEKKGGNVYIAKYDLVKAGNFSVKNDYPTYYEDILQNKGLWMRLLSIEHYSKEKLNANFVINSSGNKVSNVFRSMCPATFLKYKLDEQ